MDKKKLIVALVAVLGVLALLCCGGVGVLGFKAPTADAKLVGNTPEECEQGCAQPCFCNRSCFLAWCWGDYYCQCND